MVLTSEQKPCPQVSVTGASNHSLQIVHLRAVSSFRSAESSKSVGSGISVSRRAARVLGCRRCMIQRVALLLTVVSRVPGLLPCLIGLLSNDESFSNISHISYPGKRDDIHTRALFFSNAQQLNGGKHSSRCGILWIFNWHSESISTSCAVYVQLTRPSVWDIN